MDTTIVLDIAYDVPELTRAVEYELQQPDSGYLDRARGQRKRTIKASGLSALVVGGLIAWMVMRSGSDPVFMVAGIAMGAVIAGLYLMYAATLSNYVGALRRQLISSFVEFDAAYPGARVRYVFSPTHIEYHYAGQSHSVPWSTTLRLWVRPNYMLLYTGDHSVHFLLAKSWPDEQSRTRDWAMIRAWFDDSRRAQPERIADFMRDRELACRKCSYNLRGLAQEKCPECGLAITREMLGAWEAERAVKSQGLAPKYGDFPA